MTRIGEGEGRATLRQREGKVIAGVAACALGAMTSLLLLVIMYSVWPKVCHNGGGANARFVFCQLNSNIVNNIISTKAIT